MSHWQSTVFAVLNHPTEPSVLLIPDQGKWSLPLSRFEHRVWIRPEFKVNQVFGKVLGCPVIVLHCISYQQNKETQCEEGVFAFKMTGEMYISTTPNQWLDRNRLARIDLTDESKRPLLETHLQELETGSIPTHRPPWTRPGWFSKASFWLEESLRSQDLQPTGPVQQYRNWCLSAILTVPTAEGTVYFKASQKQQLFPNEAEVLQNLSILFPKQIPKPLAVDVYKGWFVLPDLGESLTKNATVTDAVDLVKVLGNMQLRTAGKEDELLKMGCVKRDVAIMPKELERLLNDPRIANGLTAAEELLLPNCQDRLSGCCGELSAHNIPNALVHGDFHLDNAVRREKDILLFDWADAAVSHPFLDLIHLYDRYKSQSKSLLSAYFLNWIDFESSVQLNRLWSAAVPLGYLYSALSYWYKLTEFEPASRAGFNGAEIMFLRNLLDEIDSLRL